MQTMRKQIKCVSFLLFIVIYSHKADAVCYVCNDNGAACTSYNTFYLCIRGLPNLSDEFTCPNANEVCTKLGLICVDATTSYSVKPACADTSQCGRCAAVRDGVYTCTSRNSFTMCIGNALTQVRSSCPLGEVCLTSLAARGGWPCANECLADADDMCDVEWPVDAPAATTNGAGTTPVFQPTPPTGASTPTVVSNPTSNDSLQRVCQAQVKVGRYAYPNDSACFSYVYCYYRRGEMVARPDNCPMGRFFNAETHNCQVTKPAGCI